MNTKLIILSSLAVAAFTTAVGQQAPPASPAQPAQPAAPAAGQGNRVNPPGTIPPGTQNREQLPPGTRDRQQLPPGFQNPQFGAATNFPGVNTNAFAATNNRFAFSNRFALTNPFPRQFGAATNQFRGTNQFGVAPGLTNPLAPTGSVTNRVFGTNIPGFTNAFGTNAMGQGFTPADRALLTQVQQVLQPVLSSSGAMMPVRALTREGVVTLVGVVPTIEQSQQLESVVAQVNGVVRVNNRLVVNANPSAATRAP